MLRAPLPPLRVLVALRYRGVGERTLFSELPRRVLLGNPYSPSRIPTRDRQKHGWLNIQLVSRSRTATPEGPQLGSPRCRVIVGPRSYCIGAFPAAVAFVPPLSLLPAKVLWYLISGVRHSRKPGFRYTGFSETPASRPVPIAQTFWGVFASIWTAKERMPH